MGTVYRVNFINDITNCYGKLFNVCQRSIVIRSARSPERAIGAAKIRFARLERIRNWALRAERIELDVLPTGCVTSGKDLPVLGFTHKATARRSSRRQGNIH